MKLRLIGCSHHHSSVALRERLAFDTQQTAEALRRLRVAWPRLEAVLLSTCNRVELYAASESSEDFPSGEQLADFLTGFHGIDRAQVADALFAHQGEQVIRHLFAVTAGLDSMVLGEPQIMAQVKQAYRQATELASAGPLTHAVFQSALRTAKRVAGETTLQQKRVSIPSVAVGDFARGIFDRFDDKRILVIGAGEMAAETLRYLRDEGAADFTIVNRHRDRAEELARQWEGRALDWDGLPQALATADLVVSTTGASQPVVTLATYETIEHERFQRPLVVLDLAVPRDVDPAVGDRLGVFLYTIDDLQAVCEENRAARDREVPAALALVEEETAAFMSQWQHRASGPVIQRLREGWQRPKDEELRRLFNKLPQLDESARAEIGQSFDRLMNKLLHPPLESLRDEQPQARSYSLIEALKRLFHSHLAE